MHSWNLPTRQAGDPFCSAIIGVAHGKTTENRSARSRSSRRSRYTIVLSNHSHVNGIRLSERVRGLLVLAARFVCSFAARLRSLGYDPTEDGDAFCPPPEQLLDRHGMKRPSEDMHAARDFRSLPRPFAAQASKRPPRDFSRSSSTCGKRSDQFATKLHNISCF